MDEKLAVEFKSPDNHRAPKIELNTTVKIDNCVIGTTNSHAKPNFVSLYLARICLTKIIFDKYRFSQNDEIKLIYNLAKELI
jgi:hypothetical protein